MEPKPNNILPLYFSAFIPLYLIIIVNSKQTTDFLPAGFAYFKAHNDTITPYKLIHTKFLYHIKEIICFLILNIFNFTDLKKQLNFFNIKLKI